MEFKSVFYENKFRYKLNYFKTIKNYINIQKSIKTFLKAVLLTLNNYNSDF